jgi:hypothetical protein
MTAESRRLLGYGLLAGSAGIALLMLAWLMTSGVQAGGAVLGLLLLFVLAGPLAAGGYYVLVQGRADTPRRSSSPESVAFWMPTACSVASLRRDYAS